MNLDELEAVAARADLRPEESGFNEPASVREAFRQAFDQTTVLKLIAVAKAATELSAVSGLRAEYM